MLNTIVLVGKIHEMPITKEIGSRNLTTLSLECCRSFANSNGIYENDIIPVIVWKSTAEMAVEKLVVGDIVTMRGRLQTKILETKEGKPYTVIEIIGERVTAVA